MRNISEISRKANVKMSCNGVHKKEDLVVLIFAESGKSASEFSIRFYIQLLRTSKEKILLVKVFSFKTKKNKGRLERHSI